MRKPGPEYHGRFGMKTMAAVNQAVKRLEGNAVKGNESSKRIDEMGAGAVNVHCQPDPIFSVIECR